MAKSAISGLMNPPNLKAGFKTTGILSAGINTDILVKFHKAVKTIDQKVLAANSGVISGVQRRAKKNLRQSILRPAESGINEDSRGKDRNRQTKKFTFGDGGAFQARSFAGNNEVGFGYPDIATADRHTKGIWRVLEFGLGNRAGQPQAGVTVPALAHDLAARYGSKGKAMLPATFGFTSPNRATAQLIIVKGPAVASGARYVELSGSNRRRKNRMKKTRVDPQGNFGKFFLTRAVDETVAEAFKQYERIPTEAYR